MFEHEFLTLNFSEKFTKSSLITPSALCDSFFMTNKIIITVFRVAYTTQTLEENTYIFFF